MNGYVPEYTLLTVIAVIGTVALEIFVLRTGIFRTAQYWVTMLIVFAFQIPVDGWLTKLRDPIVIYNPSEMIGIRAPWDIPVEDFGFGFAMVTLTILGWRRMLDRRAKMHGGSSDGSKDRSSGGSGGRA